MTEPEVSQPMLALENISKKFRKHIAVDQLNFMLHRGKLWVYLALMGQEKAH